MMIARGVNDQGEQCLLLGLSRGNIERLIAGQPIRLSPETHGDGIPAGWKILLLFGETEHDIVDTLQQSGAIGVRTAVHVEPRLSDAPRWEPHP